MQNAMLCVQNTRLLKLFHTAFAALALLALIASANIMAHAQEKPAGVEQSEKRSEQLKKVAVKVTNQGNGTMIGGKFFENANEFAPIVTLEPETETVRPKRIARSLFVAAATPPRVFASFPGAGAILAFEQTYADSNAADTARVTKTGISSIGPLGFSGGQLYGYQYGSNFLSFTMNTAGRALFTDRVVLGGVNNPLMVGKTLYAGVFESNNPLYTATINSAGQPVLPKNPLPVFPGWASTLTASPDGKVLFVFDANTQALFFLPLTVLNPQYQKVAQINRHVSAMSVMKDGRILLFAPIYYNGEQPPTLPSILMVSAGNGATLELGLKGDIGLPEFTESLSMSSDGRFWVLPNNRFPGQGEYDGPGSFTTGLLLLEDTNGDGAPDTIREWLGADLAPSTPISWAVFQP